MPSGETGRSPAHGSIPSKSRSENFGKYACTDLTMPRTRAGLIERSRPPTSIVPPKRKLPSIGVIATFASAKIEQSCGSSGGVGKVSE